MSNMAYPLLLLIFIFGAVAGYINDSGLYSAHYTMPENNVSMSEASVTELTESAQQVSASDFSFIEWIVLMGKAVMAGVLALFTLGPLLESYGIPTGMVGFLISPLGFVAAFWVLGYFTGREQE